MRRSILYIILLGTTVFSCSSIKPAIEESSCDQSLKEFVENNWIYDTSGIVKLDTGKVMKFCFDQLPESKCLVGKNKEEIKHLFGEPHMIRLGKFMYYTIGTCFTKNSTYCMYIHFDFDENGVYKTIGVSGWSKSY